MRKPSATTASRGPGLSRLATIPVYKSDGITAIGTFPIDDADDRSFSTSTHLRGAVGARKRSRELARYSSSSSATTVTDDTPSMFAN